MPALPDLPDAAVPDGALPGWLVDAVPLLGQVPAAARASLVLLVVTFTVWAALHLVVTIATRPMPVRPGPATQELGGEEPPAVVSVLAAGWTVTEDAAEATLIDLAARGYLEFRQPDADPLHTTVHVTAEDAATAAAVAARAARVRRAGGDAPLTGYEQQVLDHVQRIAVGGVVPLTALTFRDEAEASAWTARFGSSVLADARRRGLVRRRVPPWAVTMLDLVALLPSAALGWLLWELDHRSDGRELWIGILLFGLLSSWTGRRRGLKGTAKGRAAAARWLGLKAYLQVDRAFAALPPSAVAVWDRYLAYGDALGVTHVISAVVDLGLGNRRLVWSSFGGQWRQVRVKYPGARPRYGASAPKLLAGGLVVGAFGAGVLWVWLRIVAPHPAELPAPQAWFWVPLAVGGLPAAYGAYAVVRTLADLLSARTLIGQVLWVAPWRTRTSNDVPEILTHYLAVDDGTADATTSWALPNGITRGFGPGDVVEITVRPWSRRVTALRVTQSRHIHPAHETPPPAAGPAAGPAAEPGPVHRPPMGPAR